MKKNRGIVITNMSKFDYLSLDGRLLHLFLTVMEEQSVSAAAGRLGITQSAVSHSLDKLRKVFCDPLFIRAGRGIVPTARAQDLVEDIRNLLSQMQDVTAGHSFVPEDAEVRVTIAANDLERNFLLPSLYRKISRHVRDFSLRVVAADFPTVTQLRQGECDFLVSPSTFDAPDVMQRRLWNDRFGCFYDSAVRGAPKTLAEYRKGPHVGVSFLQNLDRKSIRDFLGEEGRPNVSVSVPNFSGIAAFVRGGDMIATQPKAMGRKLMPDLACAELPFEAPELSIYLLWHKRYQSDPVHKWLRGEIDEVVSEIRSSS